MPTGIDYAKGTTTFSDIFKTFGDGAKGNFGMRLDGNRLYTHGKLQLHGRGEDAVASRAQKKADAAEAIRDALTTEFGSDFATKVMVRLQTDRGLDLRQGVVTRGQLQDIHHVVTELQKEIVSGEQDGFTSHDTSSIGKLIADYHADPQTLRAEVNKLMTADKVRTLVSGTGLGTPAKFRAEVEKAMIRQWKPIYGDDVSPKQVRAETRKIEAMAKAVIEDAMKEIFDEIGIAPTGSNFTLNKKGMDRVEGMLTSLNVGSLSEKDVADLAAFHDDPAGLRDHLDDNPQVALRLLSTPRAQLEKFLELGGNVPGLNVPKFMVTLATAGGMHLDTQGLHCNSARLAGILDSSQAMPGVKPEFAYRVEVELQRLGGQGRIGGPQLTAAANNVVKGDLSARQKIPDHLEVLGRAEMSKVGAAVNDADTLKTLFKTDRNLMIKVATTRPDQLKAHVALMDRGGLSVDEAYDRILQAIPGHDAVMRPDGGLDTLTIQGATYKAELGEFGDPASYGDIIKMNRQGKKEGTEERIVLKKLKVPEGMDRDKLWEMMSNEIRLHSHASSMTKDVVKFLEPVRIGDDLYMAMECCDGGSLSAPVFNDGIGELAKQTEMEPLVETALKLSYMVGMLEPLAFTGDVEEIVHHDIKGGNFLTRGDGTVVMADMGTASHGATSINYGSVDNPEQNGPESVVAKRKGPPYDPVTHKNDCYAFGVAFLKFMLGNDMHGQFSFNADRMDMLEALHEHRNGFRMPNAPTPPNPPLGAAQKQYEADKAAYDKAVKQKKLIEKAGYTIGADGSIAMFPGKNDNPLKDVARELLHPDATRRLSAVDALGTDVMLALNDPELRQTLKDLRSLISQIKVEGQTYKMTDEQRARFDKLTEKVMAHIEADDNPIWEALMQE